MRVLVVEDHQPTIELMDLTLTAFGHTVLSATGIVEALALISHEHPDIVLSDLIFADSEDVDQDGYALARRVKANPEWAKIVLVAISGVTSERAVQRALRSGFDDVFIKPFDVESLLGRIEDLVAVSRR